MEIKIKLMFEKTELNIITKETKRGTSLIIKKPDGSFFKRNEKVNFICPCGDMGGVNNLVAKRKIKNNEEFKCKKCLHEDIQRKGRITKTINGTTQKDLLAAGKGYSFANIDQTKHSAMRTKMNNTKIFLTITSKFILN
jgi:superfamily II helicase